MRARVGQYRIPTDIAGAGPRRSSVGVSRRVGRARRVRADRVRGRAAVGQPRIRGPRLRRPGPRDRGARARPRSGRPRSRRARGRSPRASSARLSCAGCSSAPRCRRRCACSPARARGCPASPSIATATSSSCSGCRPARCPGATSSTTRSNRRWQPRGIYEQRRFRPLGGRRSARARRARARRGGAARARGRGRRLPLRRRRHRAARRRPVPRHAPRLGGRRRARAAGRRVLNLFSYTGAFSVHAAKAGAAEVVAVDTAAKAHARARRNFELSGPRSGARHETMTADAIKTLERFASRGRSFDIVVCDPPTFSHGPARAVLGRARSRRSSRARARPCSRRAGCSCSRRTRPSSRPPSWIARWREGARRRTCRAAHHRARRAAARLSGRPGFPGGELPQGRDRGPRSVVASATLPDAATRAPIRRGRFGQPRGLASRGLVGTVAAALDLVEVLPDGAFDVFVEVNLALRDLAQRRHRGLVAAATRAGGRRWRAGARARRRESPARSGC